MRGFFEKRKFRRRLYSRPVLLVLAVLTAFLGHAAYQAYEKAHLASERLSEQEAQLSALQEREEALEQEVERLSSERGKEREIREKYDVGREGEGVIVILDAPKESQSAAGLEKGGGFFSKFFGFFTRD